VMPACFTVVGLLKMCCHVVGVLVCKDESRCRGVAVLFVASSRSHVVAW
jgi:hypothetical protein